LSRQRMTDFRLILSELLFVLLPLLVLALVYIFTGRGVMEMLDDAEWSFAAAVLMGQAIVKYVSRAVYKQSITHDVASLWVAALIVVATVPTLTILSFVLMFGQPLHKDHPGLVWTQVALFIIAVIIFIVFGAVVGRERGDASEGA